MVKEVRNKLESISKIDKRIKSIYDIRIVNTNNHNLILFGINTPIAISRGDILELDSYLQKSLSAIFNAYEIRTKISPIYKN